MENDIEGETADMGGAITRQNPIRAVLRIWTWRLEHSVVWAVSFICVCGLFQTFTQDFSVQFVNLVFLSSRHLCDGFC